jgi:hypothetical protein
MEIDFDDEGSVTPAEKASRASAPVQTAAFSVRRIPEKMSAAADTPAKVPRTKKDNRAMVLMAGAALLLIAGVAAYLHFSHKAQPGANRWLELPDATAPLNEPIAMPIPKPNGERWLAEAHRQLHSGATFPDLGTPIFDVAPQSAPAAPVAPRPSAHPKPKLDKATLQGLELLR